MRADIPCPTSEEMRCFMLGMAPEPLAALLDEHLSRCEHCDRAIDTLAAEDTLVEAMRAQARLAPEPEEGRIKRLIERLQLLRPRSAVPAATQAETPAHRHDRLAPGSADSAHDLCVLLKPAQAPDEIGRLGPYRVLGVLGSGGMGVVFHAEDTQLRRSVALKTIRPGLAAAPSLRQRFLREAQAAAALHHDHIMPVYNVGEEDGVPFLTMPLTAGETLEQRLRREQRLPLPAVLRIGAEVATGLAAAHEHGLVHRDVKPANVWLEAGTGRARILDFGLARVVEEAAPLTAIGAVTGTPGYLAPEQARAEPIDLRCDLFSLGCMLYRMATGQPPFAAGNTLAYLRALELERPRPIRDFDPGSPAALGDLIERLLAKDRADRPGSAAAVADALRSISCAASGTAEIMPAAARTARAFRALSIVLVAVLGLGTIGLAAQQIVVRIRDKDGRETELTVPPGGALEVLKDGTIVDRLRAGAATPRTTDRAPNPLDQLDPGAIPAAERFDWQPKELVAVLGTHTWRHGGDFWSCEGPALAFSAEGKNVLAMARTGTLDYAPQAEPASLRCWDAATGKTVRTITRPGTYHTVYLPEVGKVGLLRRRSEHWSCQLWDVTTGAEWALLVGDGTAPRSVAASADGRYLVTSGHRDCRIWDRMTGKELPIQLGTFDGFVSAAFSGNGQLLAVFDADASGTMSPLNTFAVYDVATGKERLRRPANGMVWQTRPLFSPDGKTVARGMGPQFPLGVQLWDALTGAVRELPGEPLSLAYSPNGKYLAFGAAIVDVATGKKVRDLAGPAAPYALIFSTDGQRLAGASADGAIVVWDAATGQRLTPSPQPVRFLALAPDNKTLAVRATDGPHTLRLLDVQTGATPVRLRLPAAQYFVDAVFSPSGKTLAAVQSHGLGLWDTSSGELLTTRPTLTLRYVAYAPDGRSLVIDSNDAREGMVCDAVTLQERVKLQVNTARFSCPTFAPDGKTIAACTTEGLQRFDAATGAVRARREGHAVGSANSRPVFLAGGKRLLCGGKLFDEVTAKEVATLHGTQANLLAAPDGQSFYSWGVGGVVRRSAERGSTLQRWPLPGLVQTLAVSSDGRYLFIGNHNGTVYVLRLAPVARADD